MIQQKTKKIQAENVFIWSFKHIDFKKMQKKSFIGRLKVISAYATADWRIN